MPYSYNPLIVAKLDKNKKDLNDLEDVNTSGTVNGKVITYQSGTWIAGVVAGVGDMLKAEYVSGAGTVYNASRLEGDIKGTVQAHTVEAGKITTGTFGLARIPSIDDARIPDLETLSYGGAFATAQVPSLGAYKITTGTFTSDRILALANLKGTVTDAKIPDLETLSYGAAFATAQIPSLPTTKITTGTFNLNRIPAVDDARIPNLETLSYGAAFATAQIPGVGAYKITSGTLAVARHETLDNLNGTVALEQVPTMDDGHVPDLETLSYGAAFATAQVPAVGAYKTASGTLAVARHETLDNLNGTVALEQVPTMDDGHIPDVDGLSYGAAFATAQVPAVGAYKTASGTLAVARHETLDNLNGTVALEQVPTMDDGHIPDVDGLSYGAAFATAQVPAVGAYKTASGTLAVARHETLDNLNGTVALEQVPTMDDGHIPDVDGLSYGAAFATAQIPPSGAYKITSGTLNADRIPILPTNRYGSAVLLTGAQSIGGTKTFTDIPILPASDPTADNEAARKAYVDAQTAFHPYVGDETQLNTVSGTYQDMKNFHFVKHGSVVSPSTIRVACELKTTAGSYQMQIIVGSGTAMTFSGTESAYKLRYGDYGLGAAATGAVETRAKLRNLGAGTAYNRLYDNYLLY